MPDVKAAYALAGPNGPCCYVVKDNMTNVVDKIFLPLICCAVGFSFVTQIVDE